MSFAENKFYKPALALLAVVMFTGVMQLQKRLNIARGEMGLTHLQPLENAPPLLALTTVALGGFRGLIADALWIRASQLQQDDKYFEMVQLADWITKLQPHMVHVWIVQAWNMAYNISVKFPEASDRWRWVKSGIELLRDQALKYNPDEPLIYRELGWFYQHKIGANMDDAHKYYKEQLIREMHQALGGNGLPNYDALLHPKTPEETNRVQVLKEVYKLDPNTMKSVDDKYGPLDWRLPEAHAIYWATLGLQKSKDTNLIVLRRMIYQSMQLAFYRGTLTLDKVSDSYLLGPNLAIVPHANESYEEWLQIDAENRDNIMTAHKHFLEMLPYYYFLYNRPAEAEKWMKYVRKTYPGSIPENLSLEDYAIQQTAGDVGDTDQDRVTTILGGLIQKEYFALINDQDDSAANYDRMAQVVWKRYMASLRGKKADVRIGLDPLPTLKRNVLARLLDPDTKLNPEAAKILRTKLGLRPGEIPKVFAPPSTNSVPRPPPATAPPPEKP